MVNSKNAKTEYFDVRSAWVLDKFTPEEIALFFKEGRGLFAKMLHTDKSEQYLKDHLELAELINKW